MKKISTLAAALFAVTSLYAAADIYEIRPFLRNTDPLCLHEYVPSVDTLTRANVPYTTVDAPLGAGEKLYFNVRFVARTDGVPSGEYAGKFELVYKGTPGLEAVEWAINPPKIGIFAGGQLKEAKMVQKPTIMPYNYYDSSYGNTTYLYDTVFEYTVEPGDLGLPIRLALRDGTPAKSQYDGGSTPPALEYMMKNVGMYSSSDPWSIVYYGADGLESSEKVGYVFNPNRQDAAYKEKDGSCETENPSQGYCLFSNFTLSQCGFYVQTVDFDRDEQRNPGWKTVRQNRTNQTSVEIIDGEMFATNAISEATLYAWAVDPAWLKNPSSATWADPAVQVAGSDTPVTVGYTAGGAAETVQVPMATVTIREKMLYANFSISGITPNKTATLILSSSKDFNYNTQTGYALNKDFITCEVKCVEGQPELMLKLTEKTDVYTVTGDYTNTLTTMKLTLTDAYTEDINVTITPSLKNAGTYAVSDVIRLSDEADVRTGWKKTGALTLTIPKGSTSSLPVYLYGMGASADQNLWEAGLGNEVDFTLTPDKGTEFIKKTTVDPIYVVPENPVVANKTELADMAISGGDEVSIEIRDNFTDINDTKTGYTIRAYWCQNGQEPPTKTTDKKVKSDGIDITSADGTIKTFKPDADGVLTALKDGLLVAGELPAIPSDVRGDYLRIWIAAPNTAQAAYVDLTISTKPMAFAYAYSGKSGTEKPDAFDEIDDDGEATRAYVGIDLETANKSGGDLYAFLKLKDETQADLVSGRCIISGGAASKGIRIRANELAEASRAEIKLLDGIEDDTLLQFEVVLCTTEPYDSTKVYSKYDVTTLLEIFVSNVKPTVNNISMSGWNLDGTEFEGEATKGINQYFTFDIKDAARDLKATGDDAFTITYQFKGCSPKTSKEQTCRGNPAGLVVTNLFRETGTATLSVTLMDKDGGKTGPLSYTFDVVDNPYITIANKDEVKSFYEDESPEFWVTLSKNPTDTETLTVELTVTAQATGDKAGELTVGGDFTQKPGTTDTYVCDYLPGVTEHSFLVKSADGTAGDASKFTFKAKVTTTSYVPETETPWSDYYTQGILSSVQVKNAKPMITVDGRVCHATRTDAGESDDVIYLNSSNSPIQVAVGEAEDVLWSVSDVAADLTKGVTVTIVDDYGSHKYPVNDSNDNTFTPQFKNVGTTTLTLTATDRDGGSITAVRFYTVKATKTLNFWAVGPGVGAGNELTARYNTAGRGKGRIYVQNTKCIDATRWNFEFNCGLSSYVNAWAQGYCVGEVDDGTLNRRGGMTDTPINPNGGIVIDAADPKYYTYTDDEGKDSFFYCWIQTSVGDSGEKTSALLGVPNPLVDTNDFAQAQVTLPTTPNDTAGAYMPTTLEAVFAKEYLTTDNIGDINADGIPDIYALGYTGFGISAEEGTDTTDLSAFNDDGDYLPFGLDRIQTSFIFMTSNNWTQNRLKFDAKLEIRGYGDHLNNAWQVLSKQGYAGTIPEYKPVTNDRKTSYSEAEYDAWLQAGKPDDWSPERPSDPTKADTDGDGLPDGYEYYIWYRAKVGWISNGTHKYLTGRKYNPLDLFNPTTLGNDTIAGIYDPIKRNNDILTTDTDNDGISDYAEFALGTNPFDFDTDGDGLPDGYEVSITGTDPCDADSDNDGTSDANENPDNDTMATYNLEGEVVGVLDGANLKYYCVDDGTFEIATDTEHPATGTVFTVEVKVDETTSEPRYYLTTKKLSTYADDEGIDRLATDYPSSATWLCSYDLEGRLVRGAPTAVSRGATVVDSDEKTEFYNQTVTNVTKNTALSSGTVYNLWQYSNGAFARGTVATQLETMEKPVVAHLAGTATVKVLHYQVYQARGYDPRTSWFHTDGSVDSAKYTNLDELLSMWFLYHTGVYTDGTITPSDNNPLVTIWKNRPTNPKNADSDGDKMPDGWELYLMNGDSDYSPMKSFYSIPSSSVKRDIDQDGLEWPAEYSGLTSSDHYNWEPINPLWRNKMAPTDPWNSDTDNDGLLDGEEGGVGNTDVANHFFYNTAGIAGGGLNPLFMDTDHDGLPDPWEAEFHGTFTAGGTTTVTITEPDGTNTYTKTVTTGATWNYDGMDGTVADARLDYDGDGLANWQEYLVGAMRCWRYDDACSPWVSDSFSVTNLPAAGSAAWNQFWYDTLLDKDNVNGRYNPHLANGYFDLGRYFTCCKNAWAVQSDEYHKFFYFKDGADHELSNLNLYYNGQTYNRNTYKAAVEWGEDAPYDIAIYQYPQKYISCDPREHDSDFDGMDDYYELFHGLNPLLGTSDNSSGSAGGLRNPCDLVFDAYVRKANETGRKVGGTEDAPPTALNNWWRNAKNSHRPATIKHEELDGYDFIAHPWLNGLPNADADGDGIVNIEESIMPNVQAASTYHHTDPSSLWTTDTSYTNSLVRRFYRMGIPTDVNPDGVENSWKWTKEDGAQTFEVDGVTYDLTTFPGFSYDDDAGLSYSYNLDQWGTSAGYGFSFEENEGYDSDHDYLSDYEEMKGKTKNPSDPQIHDDPLRRQAMYFNGKDAFLQTPIRTAEKTPLTVVSADPDDPIADEARQNFLYFTVECWAKADKESLANDNGTRTLVERAIYADNAGPSDEELIRKNFLIGIKNGRWYTCYDSTGTTKEKFEITDGPVATTNWTHIAATYDGTEFRLYVNGVVSGTPKNPTVQPEHGEQALAFTPYGTMTENGEGTVHLDQDYVTILVGASVKTKNGFVFDNAWRNRTYTLATATNPEGVNYDPAVETTFADYQNYFKGYIDEVRIWDGARTKADIQGDYDNRTRYTFELATENRLAVYNKWAAGGTRAPNSSEELPAQLMYHWAFDHIPGAVDSGDVIPVPAGFNTAKSVTDASARWVRPDDYTSRGWESVAVRSKIYDDAVWVPWINNTVAHLPRLDKTTLDSFYWSEDYAGYTPAVAYSNFNITAFSFPRNAEVASRWQQLTYDESSYYDSHRDTEGANWADWWNDFTDKYTGVNAETQDTRWHAVVGYEAGGETWTAAYSAINLFRFTSRDRNTVGDDLLPMGGAFPKRISASEGGMWDNLPGQSPSASDAWAQTGNDADNNGLPDWWEEYARANYCETLDPKTPLEWGTTVKYRNGVEMPAYEAYLRDLASGLVKIGSKVKYDSNYADTRDADMDGMADWWEEMNGLSTALDDSEGDRDNDGLTNYKEYLLSEVDNKGYVDSFSPISRFSVNNQFDYFRTNGLAAPAKRYAGFDMTDHDFIEDYIEDGRGLVLANKNVYDAHQDYDCNGWSLWSEARAMNNSATWIQVGTETNLVDHTFYGEWRKRDNGDDYLALTPEHKAWLVTNKSDVVMTTYIAANGKTGPGGTIAVTEFSGLVSDAIGWVVGSGYTSYLGHEVDAAKLVGITYTTYDIVPITAYSGTPLPNVTLSVWGQVAALTNGTNVVASGDLTLKCYKGYDYDKQYFDMSAAYQTFNLTGGEELNGKTVYEFNGEGLKEGLNLFVVENGDLSGYAVANVGFDKVILNVGIDNPNAVFSASITSRVDSVAIMRTEINGVSCTERIVWSGAVDGRITPAAILKNGAASGLDLDAQYLVSDAAQIGIVNKDIGSATYQLLLSDDTGSWLGESFVKQFSADRPQGRPVGPTKSNEYTVRTRKPVFKFSGLEGATACIIEVADKENGNVLGTVTNALPTADANGVRALTTDIQIGDNVTLADGSNYVWRICGLNAKWIDAGGWSDWQSFETAIDSSRKLTGYGKLSAEIRYYGSATNDTSDVIVGVYEDAAFACDPVATVRLEAGSFDRLSVVCDSGKYFSAEAQVTVDGLPPGDYYVMAFNDRNKNGKRDPWETWGYLNMVGDSSGDPNLYTPTLYTVESTTVPNSPCCVFMEDTDVNDDYLPDCIQEESVLSSAVINTVDSDGDGLSDVIEKCIGTNPQLPDTDGDGIPDGYDKAYLSPLYNNADDEVASGDVMAFAKITGTFIMLEDGIYMLAEGQRVPKVGDSAKGLEVRTTYTYPVWEDGVIVEYLGVGTNLTLTTEAKIQTVSEDGTAVIVHAQVYDEFGYDPTTATTDENAANTKAFTALDKYLVVRYLEAIGLADEATVNKRGLWEQYTLKPYDTDLDGDGIADGWELYVMFGPDGAGSETLADAKVSPWNYDDARKASPDSAGTANEIRLIDEYDGGNAPTDPWNVDTDGDGVSDYYASKYHLSGGNSGADNDGDGLSNYAEYLISEVFKFAALDPDNAKTDGSCVDYFRKYGDLYFGEIFTDHDQVSDVWEQKYAHHVGSSSDLYANRDIYDPSADRDSDGWSNYAEAQAGTSPENITSPGVDGEILKEYPVPAIRAKVVYRGHSDLSAPLVFQAWSEKTDPDMTSTPDAAWRAATDEAETNATRYVGVNPGTVRSYYLGTGAVSPGSVRIQFLDMSYERAKFLDGEEVESVAGEVGNAQWFYFVQDRDGILETSATNMTATLTEPVKVGTIDYATGLMTIDFGSPALQGIAYDFAINGDSSTSTDAKSTAVYSNCNKFNLSRSYVKIEWLPVKTDTTGNATYYLSDCTAAVANKGHVREGKNKFVVFSDTSGDGAYTPGEPFGFVGGVDVGWQGGAFEVELTETSPIFARVDLTSTSDPTTDREAFQAGNSTIIAVEDAEKLFKGNTKLRIYGESDEFGGTEEGDTDDSGSRYVRVRVVRALVNGSDILGKDSSGNNVYVDRVVVMDKYLDLNVRSYIHEGDFLSTSSFDIGWSDLQENVYDRTVYQTGRMTPLFIDATNITYMIAMGEGSVSAGGSNTVFRSLVSRTYDSVAARQDGFVKPVIDMKQPGDVYGAKPTFRWAMQDENGVSHNSYSAFKLQIRNGSKVVYDSGYRCAPARGADGWYEWALSDPLGSVVAPGSNYTWRVAMFNAMYRDDTFWNDKYSERAVYNGGKSYTITTWSEDGEFVVDLNQQKKMNDLGYSTIAAAVKYAGPADVLAKGKVVVQAFETADFAGDPMGEAFVTDDDEIADTAHVVANARILGLPATGTYYLRAFIDSNGNGVKDDWESWGAADKSVTISTADVTCPTVGIYIEDADTDGDWIPDAYEYVTKGNLTALGPEVIDGDKIRFIGEISTSVGTAGISTGLTGASLTIFQNQSFVKLAMADLGTTVSIDDIRKAVEKKVNPDTVKITALTLAPDGSKVTLALAAEVTDSIAGELLGKVYDISNLTKQTVTVTVKVYKKSTLAEAGWTLVSTQTKTFGRDAQQIDVPVTGVNMKSGFYKVEVVQ